MPAAEGVECRITKDPLRHVINRVLSEIARKIPVSVFNDIKKALGRAEDKYRFSIYGGNPLNLLVYLESEDFRDLVTTAYSLQVDWVIKEILEALADEYRVSCPQIAEKALEVLKSVEEGKPVGREELTPETVYRRLRLMGFNPEMDESGAIRFEAPGASVTLTVKDGMIHYTICKKGKVHTVEGLTIKLEKIGEI